LILIINLRGNYTTSHGNSLLEVRFLGQKFRLGDFDKNYRCLSGAPSLVLAEATAAAVFALAPHHLLHQHLLLFSLLLW